ncbi:E3 SUMO-protein ligase PIAS2-like isoform X5 [Cherax quadricarinatus]
METMPRYWPQNPVHNPWERTTNYHSARNGAQNWNYPYTVPNYHPARLHPGSNGSLLGPPPRIEPPRWNDFEPRRSSRNTHITRSETHHWQRNHHNNINHAHHARGHFDDHSARGVEIIRYSSHPEVSSGTVMLRNLPFSEVKSTLLQADLYNHGNPLSHYTFFITPDEAQELQNPRTAHTYRIYLRFCKPDSTSEQLDYYPTNLHVAVNKNMCRLPGLYTLPRGPAEPLDITDMCNLSHDNLNNINTSTPQEKLKLFVQLVKKRTSEDLIEELKTKAPLNPEDTILKIKEKLQEDNSGDEIASTTLHCSLLCPLGKARMKLPCRASTCSHFQCFDAVIYLQMNECKPKWLCPVCSRPAEYDHLQIDGYFTSVLEKNVDTDKIILLADGSWKPLDPADKREYQLVNSICDNSTAEDSEPAHYDKTVIIDSDEDISSHECMEANTLEDNHESMVHGRGTATTPECSSVETITLSDDESLSSSSQATYQSDGVSSKAQTPLVGTVRSTSGIFQSPNFHETPESFSSTSQALNSSTPNIFSFSIAQLFTSSTPQRSGCRKMRPLLASVPKRKSKRIRQDMTNANRNNSLSNLSISSGNISRHSCTVSGENSVSSTLDNSESSGLNVITNSSENRTINSSSEEGFVFTINSSTTSLVEDISGASFIPLTVPDHCGTPSVADVALRRNLKKRKLRKKAGKRLQRRLEYEVNRLNNKRI